jgi:hypothetical protein
LRSRGTHSSRAAARQCGFEPHPLTRSADLDHGTDERSTRSSRIRTTIRMNGADRSIRRIRSECDPHARTCFKKNLAEGFRSRDRVAAAHATQEREPSNRPRLLNSVLSERAAQGSVRIRARIRIEGSTSRTEHCWDDSRSLKRISERLPSGARPANAFGAGSQKAVTECLLPCVRNLGFRTATTGDP